MGHLCWSSNTCSKSVFFLCHLAWSVSLSCPFIFLMCPLFACLNVIQLCLLISPLYQFPFAPAYVSPSVWPSSAPKASHSVGSIPCCSELLIVHFPENYLPLQDSRIPCQLWKICLIVMLMPPLAGQSLSSETQQLNITSFLVLTASLSLQYHYIYCSIY